MRELRRINGKFLDKPILGDVFVVADRNTPLIPRYRVVRVGATIKLEGVDRDLDFTVNPLKNARIQFKRVEQSLESASADDTFPPQAESTAISK